MSSGEVARERTVRNGATLKLTAGAGRVHVGSLVEVGRLVEGPLHGATGILNRCVCEVRSNCLLRTDRCDIWGQCLGLGGAHA